MTSMQIFFPVFIDFLQFLTRGLTLVWTLHFGENLSKLYQSWVGATGTSRTDLDEQLKLHDLGRNTACKITN